MANGLLAFPDRIPRATLSGGDWLTPLSNLQNERSSSVAMSADLQDASTQIHGDLGRPYPIKAVALANHNLSFGARHRLVFWQDADRDVATYEVPYTDVWPSIYPRSVRNWGDPNFFTGRPNMEDLEDEDHHLVHVVRQTLRARYFSWYFSDPGNEQAYIKASQLVMASGWPFELNYDFGDSLGYEDKSEIIENQSGVEDVNKRPLRRVARFRLSHMTDDEGFARALEIQRRLGTTGSVLVCMDPDATTHFQRRTFIGRMRTLSPLEHPGIDQRGMAFEIAERI